MLVDFTGTAPNTSNEQKGPYGKRYAKQVPKKNIQHTRASAGNERLVKLIRCSVKNT
jgi:hypothetical protein